ncbi:MAG: hypothetical protein VXW22_07360 [Pseudomonadota bacterium]|nr:hypothetical protein [Pseudomonadota bacterium]
MLRATLAALTIVGMTSLPTFAEGLIAEQVVERAVVTIDANGNESRTYETAEDVAPGDEVRYTLTYQNTGDAAAETVNLVMPVPSEVTYIEASATGNDNEISFSADGLTFAPRTALTIGDGDQERLVTADEITHIKWAFADPIAPETAGTISFSAVLK